MSIKFAGNCFCDVRAAIDMARKPFTLLIKFRYFEYIMTINNSDNYCYFVDASVYLRGCCCGRLSHFLRLTLTLS